MNLIKLINEMLTKLWAIYDKATDKIVSPTAYASEDEAKADLDEFFDKSKCEIRPFKKGRK